MRQKRALFIIWNFYESPPPSSNQREFPKDFMLDILDSGEIIEDKHVGHRRWSCTYQIVFKHEGKLWQTTYDRGHGDDGPSAFEYNTVITCTEVAPKQTLVTTYEPKE